MKIVIPTAGLGTRLRPHTWSKPKPLVSVAGQPVLGHVLDNLKAIPDVEEYVFIVGYLGDQIEAYLQEIHPDLPVRFVLQEEMLGQSHAIWLAREGLTGPMCMIFVDTLIETDLSILQDAPGEAIAWVKEVEDPRRFGVVVPDSQGYVQKIIEKPDDVSNNLAVVGFYYFSEAEVLIQAIESQMEAGTRLGTEFYLADAINVMLEKGLRMRIGTVDVWVDCGKPDAILETNVHLLEHGRDNSTEAIRDGVAIVPPVYIHPTAEITESVIGPYASISEGCVIQRSILRNCVLDTGTQLENVVLSESLIGRGVRIVGDEQALNLGDTSEVG